MVAKPALGTLQELAFEIRRTGGGIRNRPRYTVTVAPPSGEKNNHTRLQMTEADLAAMLGISRATVSRALHGRGRISKETRARVLAAADEVGFVPNAMAAELAAGRSENVGLLLRDSHNPAYGALFSSLQAAAWEKKLQIVTVTVSADKGGTRQLSGLRQLLGMRVAGLFVATGDVTSEQLRPFSSEVPMVRTGRPEHDPSINAVSYDEEHNAHLLVDHLFALGHRRFAIIETAQEKSFPEWSRSVGMIQRAEQLGAVATPFSTTLPAGGIDAALDHVVAGRATALMCPTDMRQLEALRAAEHRGLRVPHDVSITGCDGLMPGIDLLGLTTVRLPVEHLGSTAVKLMVELLNNGLTDVAHESIRGQLVVGRTAAQVG